MGRKRINPVAECCSNKDSPPAHGPRLPAGEGQGSGADRSWHSSHRGCPLVLPCPVFSLSASGFLWEDTPLPSRPLLAGLPVKVPYLPMANGRGPNPSSALQNLSFGEEHKDKNWLKWIHLRTLLISSCHLDPKLPQVSPFLKPPYTDLP